MGGLGGRGQREAGGGHSFLACLDRLTIGYASLSRRSSVLLLETPPTFGRSSLERGEGGGGGRVCVCSFHAWP